MINKRLIHINEKKTFENVKEEIPDSSICFIKESQQIYTHNQLYGSDVTVTPYPKENQVVYTTTDGEMIDLKETPYGNPEQTSNIYYKDKGYGVITFKNKLTYCPHFYKNPRGKYLKSIILPNSLTTIGDSKLRECSSLTEVNIPEGVTSIGLNAFNGCTSLKNIILPSTLLSIEEGSFYSCINLNNVIIPDSVTSLGNGAFRNCKSLTSIVIPYNISNIKDNCFNNCINLASITFLTTDCTFSVGIFCNCYSLKSFKYPDNGNEAITSNMFSNCISLETLILPKTILNLGGYYSFFHTTIKHIDTYGTNLINGMNNDFAPVKNLETLILRYNGVVQDVDTYVTTFIDEESEATKAYYANLEQGIMPLTNLDTYIGNPNSWLKIYVPANQLKNYQERYPTLKRHLHPITGEDIYALKDETTKEIEDSINYAFEWAEFD